MFRIKIKFLILVIASYIFAYLQGGNLPYSIFYGFIITFILGLICVLLGRKGVFTDIKLEKKLYNAGDKETSSIIVQNNSFVSIPYLTIENTIIKKLNPKYIGDVVNLKVNESKWVTYELNLNRRGIYDLGKISLIFKDIFSIFQFKKNVRRKGEIKVYPKIYKLQKTIFKGSDIFKNAIQNKSSIEDMYSVKDIRKYRDGDNLKRINWRVSAKYNDLYVRNFETVSGQEFNVFLNMNKENYLSDAEGLLEEKLIDFCASLINSMVLKEIKTKIFINSKIEQVINVESITDFNQLMDYFLVQDSDGDKDFNKFIISNILNISGLSGIGIITLKIDQSLIQMLMSLNDRGYSIMIFYLASTIEQIQGINLLSKAGIGCYNINEMINDNSLSENG